LELDCPATSTFLVTPAKWSASFLDHFPDAGKMVLLGGLVGIEEAPEFLDDVRHGII
jgi:hypothetical protein